LTKILKCAKDNDVVTLKANDDADSLGMVFESPSESTLVIRNLDEEFVLTVQRRTEWESTR